MILTHLRSGLGWLTRVLGFRRLIFAAFMSADIALLLTPWLPDKLVGNLMSTLIAVAALVFWVLYGLRSRWTVNEAGRALLYSMVALSVYATLVSLAAWTGGQYPFYIEVRSIAYGLLAATLTNMVFTLWLIQNRPRKVPVVPILSEAEREHLTDAELVQYITLLASMEQLERRRAPLSDAPSDSSV